MASLRFRARLSTAVMLVVSGSFLLGVATRRTLGVSSLLLGGLGLLAAWLGSVPTKVGVVVGAASAIALVRRAPVFPFRYLVSDGRADWDLDPSLRSLHQTLEGCKSRFAVAVGSIWLTVEALCVVASAYVGVDTRPLFDLGIFALLWSAVATWYALGGACAIIWL